MQKCVRAGVPSPLSLALSRSLSLATPCSSLHLPRPPTLQSLHQAAPLTSPASSQNCVTPVQSATRTIQRDPQPRRAVRMRKRRHCTVQGWFDTTCAGLLCAGSKRFDVPLVQKNPALLGCLCNDVHRTRPLSLLNAQTVQRFREVRRGLNEANPA